VVKDGLANKEIAGSNPVSCDYSLVKGKHHGGMGYIIEENLEV